MLEALIEHMERVLKGENKVDTMYLPDHPMMGASRLSKAVSFGSRRYMLMSGPPGTGKTAWVDSNIVLKPLIASLYGKGTETNYIYRSMERSTVDKLAKLISALIMIDTKEIVEPSILLGYGNAPRPLTKQDIELVSQYKDHFTVIAKRLDLIEGAASPADVVNYAVSKAKQRGVLFTTQGNKLLANDEVVGELSLEEEKGGTRKKYAETSHGKIYEGTQAFFPQDNKIYVHITDHVGKIQVGNDTDKKAIDTHSNNMANVLRDTIGYGVVDIFQLNRDIYDTYRQKNKRLTISQADIKGSNVPVENADIILGILDPHAFDIKDYDGYDVLSFVDARKNASRFRMLVCAKNSYGTGTFSVPLCFYGENGLTYEIPNPMAITQIDIENIIKGTYVPF